jgi:hypothetical protein
VLPVVLDSGPAAAPAAVVAPAAAPARAFDFLGGLGVNVHLQQAADTPKAVIAEMSYLGLDHVRDHAIGPLTTPAVAAGFGQIAAAGLQFDWLTGGPLPATLTDLHQFLSAHPGAIATIEGPNEINNSPVTYNTLTGVPGAVAYQAALYSLVHGDAAIATLPVLEFTSAALIAAPADATNVHPYPSLGAQPFAALNTANTRQSAFMVGAPVYFTEVGYSSMPFAAGGGGVDLGTQAKLTLNLIMDTASIGVRATYLYDLIDDGADPLGSYGPDHFGLFTVSGTPKPAALAIHNLTTILADAGGQAASFNPSALSYSLSGLPASGSAYVVEKSSGAYDLIIWAEPPIWNASTHSPVAAPAQSVTVDFPQPYASITVFDPLAAATPQQTLTDTGEVTLNVSDHPVVVEVAAPSAAVCQGAGPGC